jgi:hypothetical protein
MIQARTKGSQAQSDRADARAASLAPILTKLRAGGVTSSGALAAALAPAPEFAGYAATVASLRRDHWTEHLGFTRTEAATLDRLVIDPCPAQDFNGADFLYFSSFQAFVDRAERAFLRPINPRAMTRRRDIVYHGNIEPGDRVAIVLGAVRRGAGLLGHWSRIVREGDAAPLADVFTLRHGCLRLLARKRLQHADLFLCPRTNPRYLLRHPYSPCPMLPTNQHASCLGSFSLVFKGGVRNLESKSQTKPA